MENTETVCRSYVPVWCSSVYRYAYIMPPPLFPLPQVLKWHQCTAPPLCSDAGKGKNFDWKKPKKKKFPSQFHSSIIERKKGGKQQLRREAVAVEGKKSQGSCAPRGKGRSSSSSMLRLTVPRAVPRRCARFFSTLRFDPASLEHLGCPITKVFLYCFSLVFPHNLRINCCFPVTVVVVAPGTSAAG